MDNKRNYNTKQREIIKKCIFEYGEEHFTAQDLVLKLASKGITVGQATVYRMVDKLVLSGELRKYVIDGTTAACYQASANRIESGCNEHFHLKCEVCGKLIHVECEELLKISSHMKKDHGFLVDSSKTVFYGVCRECQGK